MSVDDFIEVCDEERSSEEALWEEEEAEAELTAAFD
jgi:hypothetical protein